MTDTDSVPQNLKPEPTNVEIHDHAEGKAEEDLSALVYPYDRVPSGTDLIKLADGILWVRIPLPFSLEHINVYLLEDAGGWTLVDTGVNDRASRAVWQDIFDTVLGDKKITRVIGTHLHPDHIGLAGWIVQQQGADLYMTLGEMMIAKALMADASVEIPQHELDFIFSMGVDRKMESALKSKGYEQYKKGVSPLPPYYHRIEDGEMMHIAGRDWLVIVGRGHSPEHACLYCLDEPILISGDQVLPEITSNVSVYSREPFGNPLAHWLTSLERMRQIPGDPLVLPAHGPVFKGLYKRLKVQIDGHYTRLGRLHGFIGEWHTTVETFGALFRRKISGIDFYLAMGEARAHLHLLESIGMAERRQDGDAVQFRAVGIWNEDVARVGVQMLSGRGMSDIHFPSHE